MGNGHARLAAETTALQAAAHLWWIVLWCKFQESKPKDSSDCRVLRERSTSSFNYFPPLGHRALWPNCTRPVSLSLICLIKYSSLLAAFQRHNAVSDLVSIRRLMRTLNIKSDAKVDLFVSRVGLVTSVKFLLSRLCKSSVHVSHRKRF